MSKKSYTLADWKSKGSFERSLAYQFYLQKYYNLFMGAYKFNGITYEQGQYILKKFWAEGKISAFVVEGTKLSGDEVPTNVNEYPNGVIAFVPFAAFMFNIYDYPIQVNLINVRGAKFIPTKPMVVNEDVVIGYIQKSKKSVLSVVEFFIQKIVDVEMTIRVQLKSHKVPWLIATTPENESKMKALWDKINADDEVLYLSPSEIESLKILMGGNAYIIDKLYSYKQALENELLTYLGIDNMGIMEKKEHLITDEVNSNNDLINDHSDNFLTCMTDFFGRIKEVFGIKISVEATSSPVSARNQTDEQEEEENDDVK
jgi:hypothetical protein